MSGYTLDNGTIYQNIKQINPGTAVLFSKGIIKEIQYYSKNKGIIKNKKTLEKKLSHINEQIILKLIKSCKDKYIVIPLSAGYDSRFILSVLKNFSYKNIITFSYGRANNRK